MNWPRASYSTDGKYILINDGEQAYLTSDLSKDETYQVLAPQPTPELNSIALQQMGHLSGVIGLRYPQPEQAFAWGTSSDHEAWVWDLSKNEQTVYDFGSSFRADPDLSFSGDRLAACTKDGLILITLSDRQIKNFGVCRPWQPAEVRFSVDGNTLFRTNGVLIDALNSDTGELLYNLRWHTMSVRDIAITPDGAYLVSNAQRMGKCEVILWRIDEPRMLWQWTVMVFDSRLSTAAVQQDDHVLYTVLGGLRSWRLGDGIQDHYDTNDIVSLAISPKNHLLATGDSNGGIHIWSLDNWQELVILSGHKSRILGLSFSQDGSSLLSISTDGTIRLWGLP
jgi:WD40 repeat protein